MTEVLNLSQTELMELLERYHVATERLHRSHGTLQEEVARLSAELEHKNKLLARKTRLELLGEMSTGVAHEIRNPLGGIRLYAGLLARDLAGRPAERRLVEKVISGIRSLDLIVGDLLSFTRGFEPELRPVVLEHVVESAMEAAQGELEQRHTRVRRLYEPCEVTMQADPELLKRAFLNVILNAAQAMVEGGLLTVRSGCGTVRGRAARTVSFGDTGPGVSQAMRDRLFEPFATDKESGTGLGLAMVQRVVEAHRGQIEVRNADGGGAVFLFTIPLSASESHRPGEAVGTDNERRRS